MMSLIIILSIFPFFHMKTCKSNKIFNLAVALTDYTHQRLQQPIILKPKTGNVFLQESPQRQKVIKFQQNRSFDYVGVKELKTYEERLRKISKNTKRDTMSGNFGLSRCSVNSNIKQSDLLSRNQIMEKINSTTKPKELQLNRIKSHNISISPQSEAESFALNTEHMRNYIQNQEFSFQKIKKSHQQYKQLWLKVEQKSQKQKGFPSIISRVQEERQKCLLRQRSHAAFSKENIPSRMWSTVLREKKQLKNVYDHNKKQSAGKKSLRLVGKSKLDEEKEWLNRKGNEGYTFRIYKPQQCD